jgi:hypothetical protein
MDFSDGFTNSVISSGTVSKPGIFLPVKRGDKEDIYHPRWSFRVAEIPASIDIRTWVQKADSGVGGSKPEWEEVVFYSDDSTNGTLDEINIWFELSDISDY